MTFNKFETEILKMDKEEAKNLIKKLLIEIEDEKLGDHIRIYSHDRTRWKDCRENDGSVNASTFKNYKIINSNLSFEMIDGVKYYVFYTNPRPQPEPEPEPKKPWSIFGIKF